MKWLRLGEPELPLGGEKTGVLPLALGVLDLGGECQFVVLRLTSFGLDALLFLRLRVELLSLTDTLPLGGICGGEHDGLLSVGGWL